MSIIKDNKKLGSCSANDLLRMGNEIWKVISVNNCGNECTISKIVGGEIQTGINDTKVITNNWMTVERICSVGGEG